MSAHRTIRAALLAGGFAAAGFGAQAAEADAAHGEAHSQALATAEADIGGKWDLLETYCVECHNFTDWAGGVAFDTMSPDGVPDDAEIWESVVARLGARMMPPPGSDQPEQGEVDSFVASLEGYLDTAGEGEAHAGWIPLHRLNRTEYARAVYDLLALEVDAEALLPRDPESDGFDNIASMLGTSPAFVEQFVAAAQDVSMQAVGDQSPKVATRTYRPETGNQTGHVRGLPLGTRGGMAAEHFFPADGEYEFDIAGPGGGAGYINALDHKHTVIMTIDGEQVFEAELGGEDDLKAADQKYEPALAAIQSRFQDIRVPVSAGPHEVGVAFIARSLAKADDTLFQINPLGGMDRAPRISGVTITGPFNPTGIESTPSRDRIFICRPEAADQERACAERIMKNLAARAFRRDVTDADIEDPMAFYDQGAAEGGFEAGVQQGLMAILASPKFLYRAMVPAEGSDLQAAGVAPLDDTALASRLSFFLWSQPPDAELRDLAASGALQDAAVLDAQVDRMLADPRARSLTTNFAFQWLRMRLLDDVDPDPALFPEFDGDLRRAFRTEVELFVDDVFRNDRSILDLLTADDTYVNERLALHYGIAGVRGDRFRKVTLDNPARYGLLGKGAILMSTSYGNRTSPVLRGAFVLENMIGTPAAAPPPNVEAFPETQPGEKALTVRERLESHRAIPSCNQCHGVIDPLGLALESFDAIGTFREKDRFAGMQIDASTTMVDGTVLDGPADLSAVLADRPDRFAQTLTRKMMTFALGRTVEYEDMPRVRAIAREAAAEDYRFSAIVKGIVESPQFRMMNPPEAETEEASAGPGPVREASLQ